MLLMYVCICDCLNKNPTKFVPKLNIIFLYIATVATVRIEIFEVYKFSWILWYTCYLRKIIHN